MKKKLILLFALLFALTSISIPAFAATADVTINFSLDVNGEHNIEAVGGDKIEVTYSLDISDRASLSVNQNEIFYDHTLFKLVPGSVKLSERCSNYTTATPVDSDDSHWIYFNTGSSMAMPNAQTLLVGTFTLEVIANSGESTVKNTNFRVWDEDGVEFNCSSDDLNIKIVGGSYVPVDEPDNDEDEEKNTSSDRSSGGTSNRGGQTEPEKDDTEHSENNTTSSVIDKQKTDTETENNAFSDVFANDYFYDAVLWAAKDGITSGTDATHFSPQDFVTRAQVVTFLWRTAGEEKTDFALNMQDVSADEYYADAVCWALEKGITKGTDETHFNPDDICTRGQIVTLLARFAGVEDADTESVFDDVNATDFFAAAVKWAKDNNVTDGTSPSTFSPFEKCTRGQVVTFLYRWIVGKSGGMQ